MRSSKSQPFVEFHQWLRLHSPTTISMVDLILSKTFHPITEVYISCEYNIKLQSMNLIMTHVNITSYEWSNLRNASSSSR